MQMALLCAIMSGKIYSECTLWSKGQNENFWFKPLLLHWTADDSVKKIRTSWEALTYIFPRNSTICPNSFNFIFHLHIQIIAQSLIYLAWVYHQFAWSFILPLKGLSTYFHVAVKKYILLQNLRKRRSLSA